jgi:hypothetical protein
MVRSLNHGQLPANWTNKVSALVLLGVVMLGGGIVYSLAQTIVSVRHGSVGAALTAGGLAMCFSGFLGALCVTVRVPAKRHADWNSVGATVRVNPAIVWLYGIALLGGVIGASGYLFFVSRGLADLPFATPGGGRATRHLMISLLVLSVWGLVALLRTREPGYLRIGVDGIEHGNMLRTRSARWEDLVDVTDKADKRARNPIVFAVKGAKPIVVPNGDRYGDSGAALYWMARHYWQYPENRGELADGRALDRLRREQFDPC